MDGGAAPKLKAGFGASALGGGAPKLNGLEAGAGAGLPVQPPSPAAQSARAEPTKFFRVAKPLLLGAQREHLLFPRVECSQLLEHKVEIVNSIGPVSLTPL